MGSVQPCPKGVLRLFHGFHKETFSFMQFSRGVFQHTTIKIPSGKTTNMKNKFHRLFPSLRTAGSDQKTRHASTKSFWRCPRSCPVVISDNFGISVY